MRSRIGVLIQECRSLFDACGIVRLGRTRKGRQAPGHRRVGQHRHRHRATALRGRRRSLRQPGCHGPDGHHRTVRRRCRSGEDQRGGRRTTAAHAEGLSVRFWDFLFYASFGFVVTSSVAIAGVLLVFCYLIVPSVAAMQSCWGGTLCYRTAARPRVRVQLPRPSPRCSWSSPRLQRCRSAASHRRHHQPSSARTRHAPRWDRTA